MEKKQLETTRYCNYVEIQRKMYIVLASAFLKMFFSLDAVEDKVWPDTNSICQAPHIMTTTTSSSFGLLGSIHASLAICNEMID